MSIDLYIKRVKRDLKYYPNTKLNIYKDLEEKIPKIFVPVNSDKQISTIYKSYQKNKNLTRNYIYYLMILFSRRYEVEPEEIFKLFSKKDSEILKSLEKKEKLSK